MLTLRNKENNYSVQVFKTMQGVHECIGSFDIVFVAHCCGIFVPVMFCVLFNLAFHLAIVKGRLHYVVLKTPRVQAVYMQLLVFFSQPRSEKKKEVNKNQPAEF